jgi:heat shock protein HtpX
LAAIVLMLLGGLGVLSKVPAAREGGLNRDLGLTVRIVAVAVLAGGLYLVLGFVFVIMLVTAIAERSWGAFAVVFLFGAVPAVLVGYQALNAERHALRAAGAHVLRPGQQPHLQELVTRLALTADLPVPRVAVARLREANAFSVGLTPRRSAIIVTTALLERLDEGQLKAVIAHELSHIANRDGAVMTLISAPAMVGSLLFRVPGGVYVFWFYLPFWVVGLLLLWAMSRAREFYADRGSAQLTGAPEQLMSALLVLSGKNATRDLRGVAMQALCIVRPGRRRWYELSHPSIERRIARLEALGRQLARPPG